MIPKKSLPSSASKAWMALRLTGRRRIQWRTAGFWRLVSGLILFSFALTHFLNHALGIVSLEWMLVVQDWRRAFWRSAPGTFLLVSAFLTHVGLAFQKLARRRTWRMPKTEAFQILFGILIPILGAGHVVNTRGMHELYGFNDNYAVILYGISMGGGYRQSLLLVIVWVHSVIGLNHWMRSKPWYPRWSHSFWVLAVLIPCLALSGWVSGARQVVYGTAEQQLFALQLMRARENVHSATYLAIWTVFGALCAVIIVSRFIGWLRAGPVISIVGGGKVQAPKGATLLEICRFGDVPLAAVCGGRGRCTTCRCQIVKGAETLPLPGKAEEAALAKLELPPGIRLACQIRPEEPLTVRPLMPQMRDRRVSSEFDVIQWGIEQRITVMFVDLRGFTSLAERLYPFDSVFVLNRFFDVMGQQIEKHHGVVDKYLGDGFMALFGMNGNVGSGTRNAILAAKDMQAALETANIEFTTIIGEALRMGIGIHTGRVVLGRIGDNMSGSVTALGDCVNVAARLESLNKDYGSELIVSDATLTASGLGFEGWESHQVELRGRDNLITIHIQRM